MKGFTLLLIYLASLGYLSFAKESNNNEGEQTKEWLDPWDMTHYDAAAQTLDPVSFFSYYFRAKLQGEHNDQFDDYVGFFHFVIWYLLFPFP